MQRACEGADLLLDDLGTGPAPLGAVLLLRQLGQPRVLPSHTAPPQAGRARQSAGFNISKS